MTAPVTAAIEPRPRPRSLLPKEHGAYGQLGLPLVTALALGRPSVAAIALTVAFAAAFVAHESLLVVVGHRGGRAQREDGDRARHTLATLGLLAAVSALLGGLEGGGPVVGALAVPAGLGLAMVPLIARRRERSGVGEVLAAVALSTTALPVGLASGASWAASGTAAAVWALGFAVVTVVIRGVLAYSRGLPGARLAWRAVPAGLVLVGSAALAAAGAVPAGLPLGVAPLCGLAIVLAAAPPPARRIKAVGWAVVAAGVATVGLLAATLRHAAPR